jgi:TusA-related sulfurtransferase
MVTLWDLDLRGLDCPSAIEDTLAALKRLERGEGLVVISHRPSVRHTIPQFVEHRGCTLRITGDDGTVFRMEVTKEGV